MFLIRVALDVPLPRLFDYLATTEVPVGARVLVPFGSRRAVGVVVETPAASPIDAARLRTIARPLTDTPPLPADWLALAGFVSRYYQRALGEVIHAGLPPRLKRAEPLVAPVEAYSITDAGRELLAARGRSSLRRTLLERLARTGAPIDAAKLEASAPGAHAALQALRRDGRVAPASAAPEPIVVANGPTLTEAQSRAIESIDAHAERFTPCVLLGVTGSGKTEVYLRLAERTLARGRQALVLVPEINLTPQLEQVFRQRFPGAALTLMHSQLADNERALGWLAAQSGRAAIVLGTRLAALAPFARLGLVVVDEEHDASFKQQDGVRYSARDIAIYRASTAGCPVVLGSATPSLETYANAQAGRYRLFELPARARPGARPPAVRLIELGKPPAEAPRDGIAEAVAAAIAARIARGEQSLVFLNRRGYAPVLACGACGWVDDCSRCAAHRVVHLAERRLRCHHCGMEAPIPRNCPQCGNVDLVPFGRGTQRLEDALVARFPQARIARIDSDSMRAKGRWAAAAETIRAGAVDILVGTQILAKGHDFPRVTLVAILNADAALMAADYRAPERLFAQLHQVAGRAGRDLLPGEVLLQTRYPHHPLYRALVANDYRGFAEAQLAERTAAGFPPAVAEAVLRAEAHTMAPAVAFLRAAVAAAPAGDAVALYDPVPMSLARLAGWERAHVLVQSRSRGALQAFLRDWVEAVGALKMPSGVRWHVDVDPLEF